MKRNEIAFIALISFASITWYSVLHEEKKPEIKAGNLTEAVVECQAKIKIKKAPLKVKFDNVFKYKGTKEVVDGVRFQVAGQLNYLNTVNKKLRVSC